MKVIDGKKEFDIKGVKKLGGFGMIRGLMFRQKKNCPALLFEFNKPVQFHLTSIFVFFPFLILWLDDKNKVIDRRLITSFKFHIPSRKVYSKILELPLNKFYLSKMKNLVGQKI